MFRKISSKLKSKKDSPKKTDAGTRTSTADDPGAAVPYFVDDGGKKSGDSVIGLAPGGLVAATVEGGSAYLLCEAAARGDVDGIRQLLKAGAKVNGTDDDGNTALHRAANRGQSKVIHYLLLHGADVDAWNRKEQTALYVAVENGHTGAVGVLLDYMHSVDNTPKQPFVLMSAWQAKKKRFVVTQAENAAKIKPYKKHDVEEVKILICHSQRSEDLAVFLYSILDVPVQHAFFLNTNGEMNMKNFQRFETKAKSQSLTVLNTIVRSLDAIGYEQMRCLILVSCQIRKLGLQGLVNLELLDIRQNKLKALPETINECKKLKTLKCSHNNLRNLPQALGELDTNFVYLDCSCNNIKRFSNHIVRCASLRVIECSHNGLLELPMDIGLLTQLEELNVSNNKLSQLPISISTLKKLKRIGFNSNPLQNIPVDFPERPNEVREYLKCLQDDPIPNRMVKLVIVGQEGVGKTSLLKALKRTFWAIPRTPTINKTDGIDIKDIKLDEFTLRCFDCGGDVDFNETHNFFITKGALYLACFNLAEYTMSTVERGSFLLGRLQLWLQYIFTKVPNAQVLIVGTHADHPSLNRKIFEEIWEELRQLLVSAREHHRSYFGKGDRLTDCLLCQSDSKCLRRQTSTANQSSGFVNLGFDDAVSCSDSSNSNLDGPEGVVSFPHVVGYYEVSSIKAVNQSLLHLNTNQSIEHLKDAVRELNLRLIETNPSIPRRWANVQESLQNHMQMNPNYCIATLTDIAKIADAQGVHTKTELINMLHFLKAQGSVLYFPQLLDMEDIVILDPEWLAKIFSSVVSFRETGITTEGFIDRDVLKQAWTHVDSTLQDNVLTLLRHFGLCLPISETNMELFPCKLPLGEPDDQVWPVSPSLGERQLTYCVTFPSLIPPPLFSELIVMMYRNRVELRGETISKYYANQILECIALRRVGCWDCGLKSDSPRDHNDPNLFHKVHIELIPHRRIILITVRGALPCCMMKKISKLLTRVVSKYEGLGIIELDSLLCPACHMQKYPQPHKFSVRHFYQENKEGQKIICSNAHALPEPSKLIIGVIHDSFKPNATIRPKHSRDNYDYSGCPKLTLMLPVNKDGVSFDNNLKLFVSSLMFDGYAVHLLCEFPDGYHLTRATGYRLKTPKEFMGSFGEQVYAVLHLLEQLSESTVSAKFSSHNKAVTTKIEDIIQDLASKFPNIKDTSSDMNRKQLLQAINNFGSRISRDELRKFLNMVDKPAYFGSLRRLKYGDQWVWLCTEHYRQLRTLTLGTARLVQGLTTYNDMDDTEA